MRNLKQAILYPGIGLLETVVSVGRGTDTPFEVVGAPYINDLQLAADLNAANIPGVRFVPIRFTPTTSLFKNQECGGVYIFLENRNQCPVVEVGLTIAKTLARRYPGNFALEVFNRLLQDQGTINAIASQANMETIQEQWYDASLEFLNRRSKYLIYR